MLKTRLAESGATQAADDAVAVRVIWGVSGFFGRPTRVIDFLVRDPRTGSWHFSGKKEQAIGRPVRSRPGAALSSSAS